MCIGIKSVIKCGVIIRNRIRINISECKAVSIFNSDYFFAGEMIVAIEVVYFEAVGIFVSIVNFFIKDVVG
jgi:hypothetical protein